MNAAFFLMEEARQQRILNAAYEVFAHSSYRKASMLDIAWKAGISKSLLFYYFKNKKELYLYLWNQAAALTYSTMMQHNIYTDRASLFDMMEAGMYAKFELMEQYPDVALFALRAIMEEDAEVQEAIQASYQTWFNRQINEAVAHQENTGLRADLDLNCIIEQLRLAGEGYLWRMQTSGNLDLEQLKLDTLRMMKFWKQTWLQNPGKPPVSITTETAAETERPGRREDRNECTRKCRGSFVPDQSPPEGEHSSLPNNPEQKQQDMEFAKKQILSSEGESGL